jgi:hypothetical protein
MGTVLMGHDEATIIVFVGDRPNRIYYARSLYTILYVHPDDDISEIQYVYRIWIGIILGDNLTSYNM